MHALVFANGDFCEGGGIGSLIDSADLILCADGGTRHALALGLRPDGVIGDLDSLSSNTVDELRARQVRVESYPEQKDETDLELALLYAVERGATEITVLGAWGGRVDHTLGNVFLMAHPRLSDTKVRLVCENQEITIVRDEAAFDGQVGDWLSLLPFGGDADGVVTTGLAYPLCEETLALGPARGVSNVFVASRPTVSLRAGLLIAVHTRTNDRA
jgi:thiamine pyrophosphokinase